MDAEISIYLFGHEHFQVNFTGEKAGSRVGYNR